MGTTRRKLSIVVDAEYNGGTQISAAADSVERLGLESEIASQKQSMFAAKQRELAAAVSSGAKNFDEAERELKQYGDELERGIDSTKKAGFSFGDLKSSILPVTVALGAVTVVGAAAYKTIGEGADLIAAEQKFGNLAESIDTTADVLLGKMTAATNGMVSQAQLIAAGTDIMNLGLAKSEDGVVRLASAVGALDLDMGVLALTLANDSTARLDSLGLSLEDVTAKKKELIASGFIGDAFDEAVLISLEEKMTLLGDASKTTAGQMAIMEAAMTNAGDEVKIVAADLAAIPMAELAGEAVIFANNVSNIAEAFDKLKNNTNGESSPLAQAAAGFAKAQALLSPFNALLKYNAWAYDEATSALRDYVEGTNDAERTTIAYYEGMGILAQNAMATADEIVFLANATNTYVDAGLAQARATRDAYEATQNSIAAYEAGAGFLSTYAEAGLAAAEASRQQAGAVQQASEQYTTLSGFMDPLKGTAENTAEAFDNLAVSIVNAQLADAVAAGQLTAEQAAMSSVNVQQGLGLIDEAQADQLREAATQFGVIEEAITIMADEMVSAGGITVQEAEKMQSAIDLVGTGSQATGEYIAGMYTESNVALTGMSEDFQTTTADVDVLNTRMGALKDMIIDGLPDEKIIKIKIVTEGTLPDVGGNGTGSTAATTTAVSEDMGR